MLRRVFNLAVVFVFIVGLAIKEELRERSELRYEQCPR